MTDEMLRLTNPSAYFDKRIREYHARQKEDLLAAVVEAAAESERNHCYVGFRNFARQTAMHPKGPTCSPPAPILAGADKRRLEAASPRRAPLTIDALVKAVNGGGQ